MTYSPGTIRLMYEHTLEQHRKGINGAEMVMINMGAVYGYETIEEANQKV